MEVDLSLVQSFLLTLCDMSCHHSDRTSMTRPPQPSFITNKSPGWPYKDDAAQERAVQICFQFYWCLSAVIEGMSRVKASEMNTV